MSQPRQTAVDPFVPHLIEWTHAKSARFWDYAAVRFAQTGTFFSQQASRALLRLLGRYGISLSGRVLDFGCGPGFFMEQLIETGVPVEGVDFSPDSIAKVINRLQGSPLFRGASLVSALPTQYAESTFDIVFLLETVEHLLDEDLRVTIDELYRILKPGGRLIVSTPNDENRALNETMCPDCGCIFHTVQHVRSWTAVSLSHLLAQHGFRTRATIELYFHPTRLGTFLLTTARKLRRKKQPFLVYIGEKA